MVVIVMKNLLIRKLIISVFFLFSMAMKTATRFSVRTDTTVFKRLGTRNQENVARNHQLKTVVCKSWLEGRCTRNPCNFMHQEIDTFKSKYAWNNPNTFKSDNSPPIQPKSLNKNENSEPNQIVIKNQQTMLTSQVNVGQSQSQSVVEKTKNCMEVRKSELNVGQTQSIKKTDNSKNSEVNVGLSQSTENCKKRKNSENLQSDYGLSMVAQLEGHTKGVNGIVYDGYNKLFCGSKDKSVRVWECNNGQCVNVVNFDNECRTLVKEGPWIFAGLKDMIKAWNFETQTEVIIRASGGYVNAITMYEDILFAGMEDGSILSWEVTSKISFFEELPVLKGHTGSVLCLIIGAKKLYSGSADHTIRAWDCETLECTHVLNGHTGDVTAVICLDQYLFSGSLDESIKIWGATESGNIEQVYQHDLVNGVVGFCGFQDAEEKPLLLCSCTDNGVYVYDLPSFCERGKIVSECDIEAMQVGPEGLFITGDASGLIRVWKLNGQVVCN